MVLLDRNNNNMIYSNLTQSVMYYNSNFSDLE